MNNSCYKNDDKEELCSACEETKKDCEEEGGFSEECPASIRMAAYMYNRYRTPEFKMIMAKDFNIGEHALHGPSTWTLLKKGRKWAHWGFFDGHKPVCTGKTPLDKMFVKCEEPIYSDYEGGYRDSPQDNLLVPT